MGYQPYFFEICFCSVLLNVDLYGYKTKPTKPISVNKEKHGPH